MPEETYFPFYHTTASPKQERELPQAELSALQNSRIYTIKSSELPLKSEGGGGLKGFAVKKNIQRAQALYDLFHTNRTTYEKTVQDAQHKDRVVTLGIIADIAGETELAIDLFRRAKDKYYLKYIEWRERKGSVDELASSLDDSELGKTIGIFVRRKEFDIANDFRSQLRTRLRQYVEGYMQQRPEKYSLELDEAQRLSKEAAETSASMHDWTGLLEDLARTPIAEFGVRFELFDIIQYARICRKEDRQASDRLYELVETIAQKERRWGFVGMARAGRGDKVGAIKAYEKGHCFMQAINLRKNLNLPFEQTGKVNLRKTFHEERIKYLSGRDDSPFGEELEETETRSYGDRGLFTNPSLRNIEHSLRLARQTGLQDFLKELLGARGYYGTIANIERLSKTSPFNPDDNPEQPESVKLAERIDTIRKILNKDIWQHLTEYGKGEWTADILAFRNLFSLDAIRPRISVLSEQRTISPQQFFDILSVPKDAIDFLVLEGIARFGRNNEEMWQFKDSIMSIRRFGSYGLEAITSLFQEKKYELIIECTPRLITEYGELDRELNEDPEEDLEKTPKRTLKTMQGEIETQKQIAKMVRTAGKRLRRNYVKLGISLDDLWGINFDSDLIEKRVNPHNF